MWFALSSAAVLMVNVAWLIRQVRDNDGAGRRGIVAAFAMKVAVDSLMVCAVIALLHLMLRRV